MEDDFKASSASTIFVFLSPLLLPHSSPPRPSCGLYEHKMLSMNMIQLFSLIGYKNSCPESFASHRLSCLQCKVGTWLSWYLIAYNEERKTDVVSWYCIQPLAQSRCSINIKFFFPMPPNLFPLALRYQRPKKIYL